MKNSKLTSWFKRCFLSQKSSLKFSRKKGSLSIADLKSGPVSDLLLRLESVSRNPTFNVQKCKSAIKEIRKIFRACTPDIRRIKPSKYDFTLSDFVYYDRLRQNAKAILTKKRFRNLNHKKMLLKEYLAIGGLLPKMQDKILSHKRSDLMAAAVFLVNSGYSLSANHFLKKVKKVKRSTKKIMMAFKRCVISKV